MLSKPKPVPIPLASLLDEIESLARDSRQWAKHGCYDVAAKRVVAAQTLLDILDVHLTGSSGASYLGLMTKGHINADGCACRERDVLKRAKIIRAFIKR